MLNIVQDFMELMFHHVATISLLVFSWANSMVRIGTLVLCIHDAVDYLMEVTQQIFAASANSRYWHVETFI